MKSKIWPLRPRKRPLDLEDLRRGSVNFFKKYIFWIRAKHWEKWAIAQLSRQTLKIARNQHFFGGLEDAKFKSGNFQSLTRKLSYSSFFSVLCPDLKNVFFGKIHWAPSEVLEVKRLFSRSRRPNFGFHLFLISFHLEFSLFWVSRSSDLSDLGDLRRGSENFFKNYICKISTSSWEKWAIQAWLSSRTFSYFLVALRTESWKLVFVKVWTYRVFYSGH